MKQQRVHIRCREGFSKLLTKAGFAGRLPRIAVCGGRGNAYNQFKTAATALHLDADPILLVDSEDPVTAASPWQHLRIGTAMGGSNLMA